jgi:diguanylate cyclase (GGDEF)-like protein/PAS domain S-box-containing protein
MRRRDADAPCVVEVDQTENLMALQAAALEATASAVVITDCKGTFVWVNRAFEELTGYERAEVVGKSASVLKSGQTPKEVYDELWQTILTGKVWRGELINRRKDGSLYDEGMTITPVRSGDGRITHYIAIKKDITERKRTEEQMWRMEESLRVVRHMADLLQSCHSLQEASEVIAASAQKLLPDLSGALFLFSPSRTLLEARASWGRSTLRELVFGPDDCWAMRRGRLHYWDKNDATVHCAHFGPEHRSASLCLPLVAQGETLGVICLVAEADESMKAPVAICKFDAQLAVSMAEQAATSFANIKMRERLLAEATRDPLTGLFNRRYLHDFLERELSNAMRRGRPIGVVMIDIDRFKEFNDAFGHDTGDAVLKGLADHLMKFIRRGDLACRYGGEEFTLILPDALLEDTRRRAEELRASVKQLSINHGNLVMGKVALSLGVAAYPDHGATASELLHTADAALLRAKEQGRDRVVVGEVATAEDQPASAAQSHSM